MRSLLEVRVRRGERLFLPVRPCAVLPFEAPARRFALLKPSAKLTISSWIRREQVGEFYSFNPARHRQVRGRRVGDFVLVPLYQYTLADGLVLRERRQQAEPIRLPVYHYVALQTATGQWLPPTVWKPCEMALAAQGGEIAEENVAQLTD